MFTRTPAKTHHLENATILEHPEDFTLDRSGSDAKNLKLFLDE
ncbi:hypothetical protein [Azospirillum sp. SYSU D00513]|nr:hypothetical protein [Azospirillum sp. SYSU D00513]